MPINFMKGKEVKELLDKKFPVRELTRLDLAEHLMDVYDLDWEASVKKVSEISDEVMVEFGKEIGELMEAMYFHEAIDTVLVEYYRKAKNPNSSV